MWNVSGGIESRGPTPSEPAKPSSLKRAGSATPEIYVFERAEGWYPLELKDDAEACKNAECNPGTVKVTTKSGRPVWPNVEVRHSAGKTGCDRKE